MYEYRATLARVIDGDTYDLQIDLGLRVHTLARVRLRGVDTPETYGVRRGSEEWQRGKAATAFVQAWFERHGPELLVRTFKDRRGKFGRWLVEVEDIDRSVRLSEDLLAAGYARDTDW